MCKKDKKIYYSTMEAELGEIILAKTVDGLCWLSFADNGSALKKLTVWANKTVGVGELCEATDQLDEAKQQLREYLAGERKEFDLRLDIYGTDFQLAVWDALMTIPYGEARCYRDIAEQVGSPKAVRAVGGANHQNPLSIIIPCHRVIGASGSLVGYGGGLDCKRYLLELEGFLTREEQA